MDYRNYDDYIRSVTYYPNMGYLNSQYMRHNMNQPMDDLERMYPESYRIVFPMVIATCNMVTMPLTEDMLEKMTNDIYDRVEQDGRINLNMTGMENREEESSKESVDSSSRIMRRRNRFFQDFIRVLLLRELIDRRPFPFRPF